MFKGHGIIEEIYVADGDTVKAGQQLFKMKVTGEAPAAKAEAPKAEAAAPPPPKAPEPQRAPEPQAAAAVSFTFLNKIIL